MRQAGAAAWTSLVLGCSPASIGVDFEPLTRADVEHLPAGNARSNAFAGSYSVVGTDLEICACRVDESFLRSCEDFVPRVTHFDLEHEAGALTLSATDGFRFDAVFHGGIDDDGRFAAGGITAATEFSSFESGEVLGRLDGSVSGSGRMELTWVARIELVRFEESMDCDFSFVVRAQR